MIQSYLCWHLKILFLNSGPEFQRLKAQRYKTQRRCTVGLRVKHIEELQKQLQEMKLLDCIYFFTIFIHSYSLSVSTELMDKLLSMLCSLPSCFTVIIWLNVFTSKFFNAHLDYAYNILSIACFFLFKWFYKWSSWPTLAPRSDAGCHTAEFADWPRVSTYLSQEVFQDFRLVDKWM